MKDTLESICPYCKALCEVKDDSFIYGRSYGRQVLVCSRYPECDAYAAIHDYKDGVPLCRVANKELRQWKMNAHTVFDPLWKKGGMSRGEAYRWLSKQLGMHRDECHMSQFDIETCKRVVKVCTERTNPGRLKANA